MDKKINIGCNGLVVKDGKLLLGLRKNCFGAGTYGLPGGHLEYGEKLADAVKRELKEEVGVEVKGLKLVSIIDQAEREKHYLQINFLVEDFIGEVSNIEEDRCEDWEWFNLDSLPENIFPPHVDAIKALKENELYK